MGFALLRSPGTLPVRSILDHRVQSGRALRTLETPLHQDLHAGLRGLPLRAGTAFHTAQAGSGSRSPGTRPQPVAGTCLMGDP